MKPHWPPCFGSLFSGIGGLDLGLERAGWTCAWQVEIDEWCRRVLTKHWPDVPKFSDIKELNGEELEPVDLIAGGPPCQPVSISGQRRGAADDRWLWPQMRRIVQIRKPAWVLCENVPGLDSLSLLDGICLDLESDGYEVAPPLEIPACAFGAPHRRYRLFIVAHSENYAAQLRRLSRADANDFRRQIVHSEQPRLHHLNGNGQAADEGRQGVEQYRVDPLGATDPDSDLARLERCRRNGERAGEFAAWENLEKETWVEVASRLCRMDNGLPATLDRVARLKGLGNAVVPAVAEWLGTQIMRAL